MRELRSFSTFETVLIETPAWRATSSMVGAALFLIFRKSGPRHCGRHCTGQAETGWALGASHGQLQRIFGKIA
jgi:hypothetical protein